MAGINRGLSTPLELFSKLDRYMIGDINKMLSTGGIGYPCIATILGGMELLGVVISGRTREPAFNAFWERFQKHNSRYNALKDVFRNVLRNGISHYYLPKDGILVHCEKPELHLQNYRGNLFISCRGLFDDFQEEYRSIKEELLAHPERTHLDELRADLSLGLLTINTYLARLSNSVDTGPGDSSLQGASGVMIDGREVDSRSLSI